MYASHPFSLEILARVSPSMVYGFGARSCKSSFVSLDLRIQSCDKRSEANCPASQSFLGLYACAKAISQGDSGKPFSCANNDPLFKAE